MVRRKAETFEPVTMGDIRGHGCRGLLVYCNSGRCHHSATMNADWLSDETPSVMGLSPIALTNATAGDQRSISPNTMSSEPRIAETSASICPRLKKSIACRWANDGARILHL